MAYEGKNNRNNHPNIRKGAHQNNNPNIRKVEHQNDNSNTFKKPRITDDTDNSEANSLGKHLLKTQTKELSKNLSSMKFMRRTFEIEDKENTIKETKKMLAEAHWVVKYSNLPIEKPKIKVEQDPCFFSWGSSETRTAGGRQSFGEFNPTIERLEREKRGEVAALKSAAEIKALSMSSEEMAEHMKKNKTSRS